ncbi:MAG: DinB family protein [Thermomicrobiales bacterium]
MDLLDRMLGHDRWAATQLLDTSRDLTHDQLDQEFDIGHRTLRTTFDHMITVIDFWTTQMDGESVTGHDEDNQPSVEEIIEIHKRFQASLRERRRSIDELRECHERYRAAFAAVARRIHDEQRLDDVFLDHFAYPQTLGGTIVQVIHHNAQHRSEVRHILERLGVSGLPDLDPQEWEHAAKLVQPV